MPPFVFFVGVAEEHVAWHLLAKAEGSRALRLVFCTVELWLDDGILRAPGICEVDKFHIHRFKAVVLAWEEVESFRVKKKRLVRSYSRSE